MDLYGFRVALDLIFFAIDVDQVPKEIRRCCELVKTCYKDLQYLIELRGQYLDILRGRPRELHRVEGIIEDTQAGLVEVCRMVERCRPEAHKGKIPLGRRLWWMWVDKDEFDLHRPIIERHHTAVVNEVSWLRNLSLLAPIAEMARRQKSEEARRRHDRESQAQFADLGNLFGEPSQSSGMGCFIKRCCFQY
jgi:hypothetical protein